MGNPIYPNDSDPSSAEKQFERIKLGRRDHSAALSLGPYDTYASVAAQSMRTTRRPPPPSDSSFRESAMSFEEGPSRTFSDMSSFVGGRRGDLGGSRRGDAASAYSPYSANEHPLRALLAREAVDVGRQQRSQQPPSRIAASRGGGMASSSGGSGTIPTDSTTDLEEIIMRQLRPRTFSLLMDHGPESLAAVSRTLQQQSDSFLNSSIGISGGSRGGGGQDFMINPADYQTMETVMGRLRRQLRNSTARMAQEASLTHRSSSSDNNNHHHHQSVSLTRSGHHQTGPSSSAAAAASGNPRDQLRRARQERNERMRRQSIDHLNPFHDAFFRWTGAAAATGSLRVGAAELDGQHTPPPAVSVSMSRYPYLEARSRPVRAVDSDDAAEEEEEEEEVNLRAVEREMQAERGGGGGYQRRINILPGSGAANRESLDRRLEALIHRATSARRQVRQTTSNEDVD